MAAAGRDRRRRWRRSTCGKRRYPTRIDALIELSTIQLTEARNRHDGRTVRREERRPYACERCRGWHLTSEAPPRDTPPAPEGRRCGGSGDRLVQ